MRYSFHSSTGVCPVTVSIAERYQRFSSDDGVLDGEPDASKDGMLLGSIVGYRLGAWEGAPDGASVGALDGFDEGDSEAMAVGLRDGLCVGSLVVIHLPPRPGRIMHVLSDEQQGMLGASPLLPGSAHLSPEMAHVVGSNEGIAVGS